MEIVIHVGLHKTGTTFLQRRVFPKMDVNFIEHPKKFLLDLKQDKINVISEEELSGRPHYIYEKNMRYKFADSLYSMFPNAKIIVGFRKTDSWLNSLWKQYVWRGGTKSKEEFVSLFKGDYLNFEMYREYLEKRFPAVHVYQFEELLKKPDETIKAMADFIGVPMPEYQMAKDNVSWSNDRIAVLRKLNYLVWTNEHPGVIPLNVWRVFLELIRFRHRAWIVQDRVRKHEA